MSESTDGVPGCESGGEISAESAAAAAGISAPAFSGSAAHAVAPSVRLAAASSDVRIFLARKLLPTRRT